MLNQIKPALLIFVILTVLTGVLYPLLVTGLAQVIFPAQANGSLITKNGQVVGSALVGQQFDQPQYFWGRLSAVGYNAATSGGSNLSALNPALQKAVSDRIAALQAADPGNIAPIPADLVTASGSGLDPNISPASAQYQAARVARVRSLPLAQVETLIAQYTQGRDLGILGEPRVNVLELNLALDGIQ